MPLIIAVMVGWGYFIYGASKLDTTGFVVSAWCLFILCWIMLTNIKKDEKLNKTIKAPVGISILSSFVFLGWLYLIKDIVFFILNMS